MPVLVNPYRFAAPGVSFAVAVAALSPAVWWRLGDAPGSTTAADSSGNSRTGSVTGVTFGATGLVAGDADTAGTFAGAEIVSIADAAWMESGTWTVMIAMKRSGNPGSTQYLASRSGTTNEHHWDLFCSTSGKAVARAFNTAGTQFLATSTTTVTDDAPHLVIGTSDGSNVRVYVASGTAEQTTPESGTLESAVNAPIVVGRRAANSAGTHFSGTLDEFAYFPGTVLTDSQCGVLISAFAGP